MAAQIDLEGVIQRQMGINPLAFKRRISGVGNTPSDSGWMSL